MSCVLGIVYLFSCFTLLFCGVLFIIFNVAIVLTGNVIVKDIIKVINVIFVLFVIIITD